MKQIAKRIAMILIIVMIANCFTGCVEMTVITAKMIFFKVLLPAFAIGAGIIVIITIIRSTHESIKYERMMKDRGPRRTNPYLYENKTITDTISYLPQEDIDSLKETLHSMPEEEFNSIIDRLNSLSKEESISLMDSINSFSVQELAAIVETFNSMSETEINTSIESLNSMPETVSITSVVQNLEVDVSGEKAFVRQRSQY